MVGKQLSGAQELQQRMIESLQSAIGQLRQTSDSIEGAGQRASDQLMVRLSEALHKLDQRRIVMTEEMRKSVQEIRALVSVSQTDSRAELQKLIGEMKRQTGGLVADLSGKSQAQAGAMGEQVEGLTTRLVEFSGQLIAAVNRLDAVTTGTVSGMNAVARTLAIGAADSAKAGQGATGALARTEGLSRELTQSAGTLGQASRSLEGVLQQYRQTRDSMGQMLLAIQGAVEAAKRDASLTSDVSQRLEGAAGLLGGAQRAADEYLGEVTKALADSCQAFADSMTRTLENGNTDLHLKLSDAVRLLREAIQELEQALGGGLPRAITVGR
jgi:hypothetical protein